MSGAPHNRSTLWWPPWFGDEDQHGVLNLVTDPKRRDALSLVRSGRMYDLGRVLDENVPVFPVRHFRQSKARCLDKDCAAATRNGSRRRP